eukprot:scaffold76424_cov27-Tisochrysis_lutea.AAC.1
MALSPSLPAPSPHSPSRPSHREQRDCKGEDADQQRVTEPAVARDAKEAEEDDHAPHALTRRHQHPLDSPQFVLRCFPAFFRMNRIGSLAALVRDLVVEMGGRVERCCDAEVRARGGHRRPQVWARVRR